MLYGDGVVLSFGKNEDGQCDIPTGLSNVKAISAGGFHSLALREDGTVAAWGGNIFRQSEVPITAVSVSSIAAGHWHNLALRADGKVVAWGRDSWGAATVPEGLSDVVAIDAGYEHSLALLSNGTVVAWGSNDKGQCDVPEGLGDVVAISAGAWQGFAVRRDGELISWGEGENGQTSPPLRHGITAVSGGYWHGMALSRDGRLFAWGDDEFHQNDVPAWISSSRVQAISAGGEHNVVLTADGRVRAWGRGDHWQTSVPDRSTAHPRSAPPRPQNDAEPSRLPSGTVWGWGSTDDGLLAFHPKLSSAAPTRVPGVDQVARVVILQNTVFALRSDGSIWGWGGNDKGQLCDGTRTDRYAPMRISGLREITEIERGPMAISASGALWAWGETAEREPTPVHPGLLSDVVQIEHDDHTYFGLLRDGTIRSWGRNQHGQIGNGTRSAYGKTDADPSVPTTVTVLSEKRSWLGKLREVEKPLSDVVDVVISGGGGYHPISVYALRKDGSVWGWGANNAGQLGDGSTEGQTRPVRLGLSGIVSLVAEPRMATNIWPWMYAITEAGAVWRWRPSKGGAAAPEQMSGLHDIRTISIAEGCVLALTSEGAVWNWDAGSLTPSQPALVSELDEVIEVAAGRRSLALRSDGSVWTWGWEPTELGSRYSRTATRVQGIAGASSVFNAVGTFFAVCDDGALWAWGAGSRGQLGTGDNRHRLLPAVVHAVGDAGGLVASHDTAFAIRTDGSLTAWGGNESNKLALTREEESEVVWNHLFALRDVVSIASGSGLTVTATRDGSVWETGSGNADETRPLRVSELSNITAVAACSRTKYALREDGSVWAWGESQRNEIGDGRILVPGPSLSGMVSQRLVPVRVQVPYDTVAIAAGDNTAYALQRDGTLWAWGDNESGQLGNGARRKLSLVDSHDLLPAPIASLSDVVAICAGGSSAFAVTPDGAVWAWGSNAFGQLGTGDSEMSSVRPTRVKGLSEVRRIATSGESTFAVRRDGSVWAWGRNNHGQLGDGTQVDRRTPTRVPELANVIGIACAGSTSFALVQDLRV